MKFEELILKRQSVRKYDFARKIEEEKLHKILEAGRLAPSACNSQPWTYVAVNEPELCIKVAKATRGVLSGINKFVIQSPLIVVMVMEKANISSTLGGVIKRKEYPLIDIGIAADHMCLQAEDQGIGSCMLGWFDEKKVKELLNIPKNKTIGLLISFGYAPEGYSVRKKIRKNFDEAVKFNSYEN